MRALLIIDALRDFFEGELRCERCQLIIKPLVELKERCKRVGIPVIYACDSHLEQDLEFRLWPRHAVKGTKGAKVIDALRPEADDYVVEKRRYSSFFGTGLDPLLRELGVKEILLAGILTDICVQHTAADAYFCGYSLIVVEDCTETVDEERKGVALDYMRKMYGAKVVRSEELP